MCTHPDVPTPYSQTVILLLVVCSFPNSFGYHCDTSFVWQQTVLRPEELPKLAFPSCSTLYLPLLCTPPIDDSTCTKGSNALLSNTAYPKPKMNDHAPSEVEHQLNLAPRLVARFSLLRHNDPDTTDIPYDNSFSPQYGRNLGEALQGNQYVSSIQLEIEHLANTNEEGTGSITLLSRYIAETESMRKVRLFDLGRDNNVRNRTAMVCCILLAISENPWMEELHLDYMNLERYAESFALLLRKTRSLKTFSMAISQSIHFDRSVWRDLVREAFVANQSLESLTFQNFDETDYVDSIFLRSGSQTSLRELRLFCFTLESVAHLHTLSIFLHSETLLEHLELQGYHFDKERMEHLVNGLQSNRSLTKLTLNYCLFHPVATDMFRCFIQTRETRSSLRELSYASEIGTWRTVRRERERSSYVEAGSLNHSSGTMLASILTMPNVIGSSNAPPSPLDMVEMSGHASQFCDALAANARMIRFPCLRLHFGDHRTNDVWEALNRCLPFLVYQKKLEIFLDPPSNGVDDISSRNFCAALQTNGSLNHVSINQVGFFNETESAVIKSTCQKNKARDSLITNDATPKSFLPLLFQSAKHAARTAPNAIAICLLIAGNSIGPRNGIKKRSVSTTPFST